MTISQIDAKQQNGGAGTRTVTLAATPAVGDLLLAAVGHSGPKSTAVLAAPAGWTLLRAHESPAATHGVSVYARIASGTDPTSYSSGALTGSGTWLFVGVWHSTVGAFTATEIASAVSAVATSASATELSAIPTTIPTPSVGFAGHHGGTTTTTLGYWDGDTIGHTPFLRAAVAVADIKIETTAPATPGARFASWAAAGCAMVAVWIPEPVPVALPWPAGPTFVIDDLPVDATLEEFRLKVVEVHSAIATIIDEIGVDPSGPDYPNVAARVSSALPATGGNVLADVEIPHVHLGVDASAALHAVRLVQTKKAIPDSAIDASTLALGYAWRYNGTTGKVEAVPSPWRPYGTVATGPARIIDSFKKCAPANSRNVEHYCLYDTSSNSASTFNLPGGGFATPSGTVMYVDPILGLDSNPGTSLLPKKTLGGTTVGALGAVAQVNAGTLQTTILVRGPAGTEIDVRETWAPSTNAASSRVRGIQAERNALVWISGSDLTTSAQWSYVAGKGWEYGPTYDPPIVTADEMDSLLYTTTVAVGSPAVVVDAVVGSLPVANRSGFPQSGNFYIQVENERMLVTGGWGSGAGTFLVTRGVGGTLAAPHSVGVTVTNLAFRLTGDIDANVGSLTLNNKSNWPTAAGFRIRVDSEIMLVTGVTPAPSPSQQVTFAVVRGYSGTAKVPHTNGARIEHLTPDSDMVFVDGVPLIQSDTPNPGPGRFFVDRVAHRLYIGEASTWPVSSRKIEITVRAYVNGGPTQRNTKPSFFVRGLGFRHWGTDWRRDTYAAIMFGGNASATDQLLEYCTFWHTSTKHWDGSSSTRMTVNETVACASGGPGAHANAATDLLIKNSRIRYANWELGYPYAPGPTERVAGMKMANSDRPTFDNTLWMDNGCNGLWHDVHCTDVKIYRTSFIRNLGYGYTQENGGTAFLGVDLLFVGNGNDTSFNKDGYRIAGVPHAHIWNATSVDNYGAAHMWTEYDWTFDTDLVRPLADGDTFDGLLRNSIGVITSRALTAVVNSWNGQPSPPGASLPAGESRQTTPFSTEMMFSPDPYAAVLAPQNDWNFYLRLNSTRPFGRWATPTGDFTTSGWSHSDNFSLAQIQARGSEAHTIGITDTSGTDAALLTKYFPNRANGDYVWPWPSGATAFPIPGTVDAVVNGVSYPSGIPNLADVPPNNVCAILGIPNGSRAGWGCKNAPIPVSVP